MSTYRTNQFHGWQTYEDADPATRTSYDNPKFLWPSDTYVNAHYGKQKGKKLQRGYMRIITEALGRGTNADFVVSNKQRLFFQFNPDTITRSVVARNDVQYWMNMDPAQLTQPVPGNSNFSFELMFNREAEVASGRMRSGNGSTFQNNAGARGETFFNVETGEFDLALIRNPSMVGVLADLYRFDAIIGQGLNKEIINAYVKSAERIRQKQIDEQDKKPKTNSNTKDEEDKEAPLEALDTTRIEGNLSINIGNSAFLVANPIRVVFSSLFMVEGYVTDTSVVFNKFNTSMVPTQCIINISMQALYIGFAKKETYLTKNFAEEFDKAYPETNVELTPDEVNNNKGSIDLIDNVFSKAEQLRTNNPNGRYFEGGRDLLRGDKDTGRKLTLELRTFEPFRTALKQALVESVGVTATYVVEYEGNNSTPPSGTYSNGYTWTSVASAEISLKEMLGQRTGLFDNPVSSTDLIFDRPTSEILPGVRFDDTATSKYNVTITFVFNVTMSDGFSKESEQEVRFSRTMSWNESGNDIKGRDSLTLVPQP